MLVAVTLSLAWWGSPGSARADIDLPPADLASPISLSADEGTTWQQGAYEIWHLRGHLEVAQGDTNAHADEAIVWIDRSGIVADTPTDEPLASADRLTATPTITKLIVYLEGNVVARHTSPGRPMEMTDRNWLARFYSQQPPRVNVARRLAASDQPLALFARARAARDATLHDAAVTPVQYTQPMSVPPPAFPQSALAQQPGAIVPAQPAPGGVAVAPVEALPPGAAAEQDVLGGRRIRLFPRGNTAAPQLKTLASPHPGEQVLLFDSGVNIQIDGLPTVPGLVEGGTLDIVADRIVVWTTDVDPVEMGREQVQAQQMPLELYLEGNIVFRQGSRVIYADRMYYDVRSQVGLILDAELLSDVPGYEGKVRLRAEAIRQLGEGRFVGQDAFITTSRLGFPSYRLASGEIYFEESDVPLIDRRTGAPVFDAAGEQLTDKRRLVTSRNNVLYLDRVPVFYWPTIATNLEDPDLYIRRILIRNDNVFGTQVLTDWNAYQLFGIEHPIEGTKWDISLDYLSDRGPAIGTSVRYDRDNGFFGLPGPNFGFADLWAINDDGHDNLGLGRRDLIPDRQFRNRIFSRHRQYLPGDYQLTIESGWISDDNFLEQYYENEWDEFKDQTTDVELKRYVDNRSWSLLGRTRLNDFFTQTEWYPRGDHFWLAQSLGEYLTWYEHSTVGYARLRTASRPTDPVDAAQQVPLPWEITNSSLRATTRHEVDAPFQLGVAKLTPYALGELGYWGATVTDASEATRAYGQAGLRASVPVWAVDPFVESDLFNLHGVAHKIIFDADAAFADANERYYDLPAYDKVDDDSVEHFRRRFTELLYGGTTPPMFDERYYALRSGIGSNVASPTSEIADRLATVRFGATQRWQTKRGRAGSRHIIDWIVLDTHVTWFPDQERDNFGEPFGLLDYNFNWHVGDRFTLVSEGIFDFFDDGQAIASVGGFLNRPPRGNVYLGFTSLDGPINAKIVTASFSYWMSPKWISTFGTSVDVAGNGNIGQSFSITRIGESMLVSFGFNVDSSKDSVGVNLAVQPRFLPGLVLGSGTGAAVPQVRNMGFQ
ncbi:MAG: LPS-assembly protein LptD [Planctomycetales bacterium]|nr:LPS-assembly protein LptD [Planctomycetales bacterium]